MIPASPDQAKRWDQLSVIPVPFRLVPRVVQHQVVFEQSGKESQGALLVGAVLLALAFIPIFLLIGGVLRPGELQGALGFAAMSGILGSSCIVWNILQARTVRTLRIDTHAATVRLKTTVLERTWSCVERPAAECELRIHRFQHSSIKYGVLWQGYVVILHVPDRFNQSALALAALGSHALATFYVEHLPEAVKLLFRGEGSLLLGRARLRWAARRKHLASLAECPICGYDLSTLMDKASRCPECGWSGSAESQSRRDGQAPL